jgi:hypothetical protein
VKFFLVLTLCSIAAFVAVLRMRPEVFSGVYSSARPAATTPAPSLPEKKNTSGFRSRSVRNERTIESIPVAQPELPLNKLNRKPDANPRARRLADATVAADTLPVYATNSSKSRVLKVLGKGDHIQTDLAVIDSVGHWSLVTLPGQKITGYVRTEDLDMTRTASEN